MPAYRAVLADAYAKLGEVETAFNAAKEEGKVLDLKNVSSDIAVKNEEVNDRIDQVVEDLTKAYADADAALKQQIEGTFNAAIEGLEQAYKNADTALKNSIAENLSKIEKATQDIAAGEGLCGCRCCAQNRNSEQNQRESAGIDDEVQPGRRGSESRIAGGNSESSGGCR